MERERVRDKVTAAIARLLKNDTHLLKVDVNERSITHRLASYLQEEFGGWDVDCEYNRNREDTKQLRVSKEFNILVGNVQTDVDDTQARTVFPDIIVHRRKTDKNLLVIEVKKTTSQVSNDFDLWKLCEFKLQLGYRHALFLKLTTGCDDTVDVEQEIWVEEEDCERLRQTLRHRGLDRVVKCD